MADNINDSNQFDDTERLWSRRAVLKVIAGAPLIATFGMLASPLMRYMKPTMKPGNFVQPADFPVAEQAAQFTDADLPMIWTCIPFLLPLKYLVFNPEGHEIRRTPGYVIRTGANEIVAFSRICPNQRDHLLYYFRDTTDHSCGCNSCAHSNHKCCCIAPIVEGLHTKNPVLICTRDFSVFDVGNQGRVLAGPAWCAPRQFIVERTTDLICISRFKQTTIV